MNEIPDAWPPEGSSGRRVVPLFPLPNAFLLPGTFMHLHIFEPRYRDMVEDCLDGPGHIVIASVESAYHDQMEGNPPVNEIAGLGEIARHDRMPGGRFRVLLAGLARVRISEVASPRDYRKVSVELLDEVEPDESLGKRLRARIEAAVRQREGGSLELPADISLGQLVDLLLLKLELPPETMRELYSCPGIAERARGALAEHGRRPLPPEGGPDSAGGAQPSA